MGLKVRRDKRGKGHWLVVGLACVVVLAVAGVYLLTKYQAGAPKPTVETKPVAAVTPVGISNKSLFMGDVFWGRYINDWSMASPLKTAYPFSRLSEFKRSDYNAWIADLECPTVAGVHMTSAEMEAALQFNCDPDYLPEAAKWFTVFSSANNHSDNQGGAVGLAETRKHLDEHGIQYFGSFDPEDLQDVCEVISLPVTVAQSDQTTSDGLLPIALCGYHGVFRIPSAESVAVMQQYAPYMPVIAYPHSGAEYQSAPDQIKTTLYRSMIDNGADVVLGDHAHWVQNTEAYKGHLIVYSMGNFMFDQQGPTEVTRSAAISLQLKLADGADTSQLAAWLKLGEQCKTFHDDCVAQAKQQGLKKLDLTYHFGVVGSDDSDKIVKPASAAGQAAILQRLDWARTITQLQAPYSGS